MADFDDGAEFRRKDLAQAVAEVHVGRVRWPLVQLLTLHEMKV